MAHRTGKPHEGRVPAEAPSESGPARRPPSPGRRSRPAADPARFSEVARQFGHDAILRGVDARLGGRVPAEFPVTDEGTRAVETVLRRIDHGDYT